jgi:hypothetical protein
VRLLAIVGLVVLVASCGDGGSSAASCTARSPERVIDAPFEVEDLSLETPAGTLDTNGDDQPDDVDTADGVVAIRRVDDTLTLTSTSAAGVTIRTWADLNGDGRDDLLIDDGVLRVIDGRTPGGTHDVAQIGIRVADELTTLWAGDLDGIDGADFYVAHREKSSASTDVYSGAAVLDHPAGADARDVPATQTLRGLPRALAPMVKGSDKLETVLFEPGEPATLSFAPRRRAPLRADLGTSGRVEWVRVFDEAGQRKIALQVDRKIAVWPVPEICD